jgi:hypothetical protein
VFVKSNTFFCRKNFNSLKKINFKEEDKWIATLTARNDGGGMWIATARLAMTKRRRRGEKDFCECFL